MYTIDNGSNSGWGGTPVNEGPQGGCTNGADEAGATDPDPFHLVAAGEYAGHPNPTRGNTANKFNSTNPQSPVPSANPVECDYQSMAERGSIHSFPASTNGLAEYTASNFGGAMKDGFLAASFDNTIYRVRLDAAGTALGSAEPLFSNVD